MGSKMLILALLALLGVSVAFMIYGWNLGGAEMSTFGYGAMAGGIILTLVVGCGLMALMFLSHRRGFDEPPQLDRDPTGKDSAS